jgi:hypothetical protein
MSDENTRAAADKGGGHEDKGDHGQGKGHDHPHTVAVTIDGQRKKIPPGDYVVSVLKAKLGVPADYDVDQVVHGEFRPLPDTAHVEIKGGEHFVSHVRRGGSS